MIIGNFLEDISKFTKEEIEEKSIPAPLDSEGHVQLTPDYWEEVDGIRYLKRPLIVDFAPWCMYTMDCASLVSKQFGPYILCVFAFSTSEEITDQLGNTYCEEQLGRKGYGFFPGFDSKEVHSLD